MREETKKLIIVGLMLLISIAINIVCWVNMWIAPIVIAVILSVTLIAFFVIVLADWIF